MSKALATKNVAAALVGSVLILAFAFGFASPAKADTMSDLQAQVQALLAQIASLQGGSSSSSSGSMSAMCHTFTRNHKSGDVGGEVMWIQQFLNSSSDTMVSASGAGSAGNETSSFGSKTKAAVMKFQQKYAADILTPVGLTAGTGNWGPSTRAKANALCAAGSTTGGTGTGTGTGTTPTGTGLTVTAGSQPPNSLAPASAIRVPFTTFTITNNSGAAVTIDGVTVQRTGLAQDNNFAGVVLVDSNGLQVGNSQTFDSNHMAKIGGTWTINAGQSQTFTVAGNMANSSTIKAGEVASVSVTGINTSAPVSGSLPITGASQTMNATLTIGTVTPSVSSFDPVSQTTKNIGDTAIKFSAVRFTAGSGEDLKFYSLRWRVNGSAGASDIGNVVTVVNGTSYPATLSADGRFYTSVFPGGILVSKGNSVDAYVQGDIVGSNASSRNIEFDIDKSSDVYFVGQLYGYGIGLQSTTFGITYTSPLALPHNTAANTSMQPWFAGSTVTIQGGTVTTIQNATSVAAQNIATNVNNQVLGGFVTNFRGEAVTIQGMVITSSTSTPTGASYVPLTLVSIVDENGAVVAGPVDMSAGSASLTFSNSMTFPVGAKTYTIKGKLSTKFNNGDTVQLTVTPSGWTSPQGQTSGNTVTISTSAFTLNTMTVRSGTLAVGASTNPSSQTVVAGGQNVVFGNIQLDASQSGEDVRLSSFPLNANNVSGTPLASLTNCQMWDGSTALNTGSNVLNTIASADNTVTFDNPLTVAKGTVKTLAVSCNLASNATPGGIFKFGVTTNPTVIGVQSGSSISPTTSSSYSGNMTVSSGATVAVTVDSSSPSYAVAAGGTTGVTVGVIKLRATNEAYNLTKLGLTLNNGTYGTQSTGSGNAATGSGDVTQVSLYSGSTLLGTATFTGSNTTATSTFASPFLVARDTDVLITVKADLAQVGVSASGGIGNLVKVDPLNVEGTGVSSGTTVRANATAGVAGVRLFKSYPTLALDTLPSTGVADGRLMHFKVTSNAAGQIGISQFKFTLSTTSATVTNIQLFGFTDSSYSQAISGQGSGGQIGSTVAGVTNGTAFAITPTTNPVEVSGTYYFELKAAVAGVTTGSSVVTTLNGDTSYPAVTATHNVASSTLLVSTNNFVWSGNSTSTSNVNDVDWSNGASLPGLPSSGLIQTRSN